MDLATFELAMASIAPYCEFLMLYWMGEPTLHAHFSRMMEIARRHIRGRIVVSTNMTSNDTSIYKALLTNADVVLCCIDRWDKDAYERIRVGAEFEAVVQNTETLLRLSKSGYPCDVVVKGLDLNAGSGEFLEFHRYWEQRGARPLVAWLNDWAGTFGSMRNAAAIPVPRAANGRTPCADLWFKLVMNWRAEIQMCCFDWDYKYTLGRMDSSRDWVRSVWHSDAVVSLRVDHVSRRWDATDLCGSCTTWGEPAEFEAYVDFSDASYFTVF